MATRPRLQQFQFDTAPTQAADMSYVNLITPPRTLTLGAEHFPSVDDPEQLEEEEEERRVQRYTQQLNG